MKAYAVKTAILAVLTAFGMNLENIVVFVEADTVEKVDKRADIIAAVFRTPDDGGRESGADLGVRGGETVSASVRFGGRGNNLGRKMRSVFSGGGKRTDGGGQRNRLQTNPTLCRHDSDFPTGQAIPEVVPDNTNVNERLLSFHPPPM